MPTTSQWAMLSLVFATCGAQLIAASITQQQEILAAYDAISIDDVAISTDDVMISTKYVITAEAASTAPAGTQPAATTDDVTTEDDSMAYILKRMRETPGVNTSIDVILVMVVIQTMLGLGCTMDVDLIRQHLLQPTGIAIAASCQFGIMPLIAFLAAKVFNLDKVSAVAVIVTGSCPGGNLSNLLTYFVYGDMNLSILMSTTSTLLALGLMPLCLFVYGSSWLSVSTIGQLIPFGGIVLTLVLTLFPVAVGIVVKQYNEKWANTIMKISLLSAGCSFLALMTLSCIVFGVAVFTAISVQCYVIAIVMPIVGYGSGYAIAGLFGLPDASRRTVAIETGCQNSQLSSTILKMAFASHYMGAYFLFPLYYALFQALEGAAIVALFRLHRRYVADLRLAPESRVTYDRFNGDIDDGVGAESGPLFYQRSPAPDDAMPEMARVAAPKPTLKFTDADSDPGADTSDSSKLIGGGEGPKFDYGGTAAAAQ